MTLNTTDALRGRAEYDVRVLLPGLLMTGVTINHSTKGVFFVRTDIMLITGRGKLWLQMVNTS